MKLKNIPRVLKKIPFLCLIAITVFLSDAIYDGILPWPSPFHITLAYADSSGRATRQGTEAFSGEETSNEDIPASGHAAPDPDGESTLHDAGSDDETRDTSGMIPDNNGPQQPDSASGERDPQQPGSAEQGNLNQTGSSAEQNDPQQADTDADGSGESSDGQPILGEDGLPLVTYLQVGDDYFDDAVFIGDSRTRSLQLYANLENTTFLADTGLTIYTVLDKKLTPSTMSSKTTVTDYLTDHQFKKVYLMLGINELGTGTAESFCRSYAEVLDTIRSLQPDAIIYLQAILHISESKDNEHTYINNAAILERNEALKSLADNEHVFWLDSNPAVCDENGYLNDSYTFDGVHLQAKYVYLWTDYLKQHAVKVDPAPYQPEFTPHPQAMP